MSRNQPIMLFAEVKLKGVPVIDARVTAHIRALNQSGILTPTIRVRLLDNGNGGELRMEMFLTAQILRGATSF